jgi:glycosyltransferase involved in cell wall biosynthesis
MLHVAQISFLADPARRPPQQLLIDWHSLGEVARATAGAGVRVSVIQASHVEAQFERDGVCYYFMAPRAGAGLARNPRFAKLLRTLDVGVLHVHGLCFPREVLALRELAPRTPVVLLEQAERVPGVWRGRVWKGGAAAADGIAFCARAQAEPFMRRGLIAPHARLFEIPESTSAFTPGDRTSARDATGVHGDPALLWVGHLDPNKDPLTVLDGVAAATRQLPGLQLWMCYGTATLLGTVEARVRDDPRLRGRVHLLGRVPHERVQQLMRAADLFVLGSHREGCNFSLIESLAAGLPAAVSDIPSSRALLGTDAGGALWSPGDAQQLARALCERARRPRAAAAAQARSRFEKHLSAPALGERLVAIYQACRSSRAA